MGSGERLIRTCRKDEATGFPPAKEAPPIHENTCENLDGYLTMRREQRLLLLKEATLNVGQEVQLSPSYSTEHQIDTTKLRTNNPQRSVKGGPTCYRQ